MPTLSKRSIDGLKPKASDYLVWDADMAGFGVRVMATGRKSYVVQYRKGGRTRRLAFARVGTLTPEEARREARGLLAAVAKGGDPSEDRHMRNMAPTLAGLCDRFLSGYVEQRCKPTTQREYKRSVELFIKPKIGTHRIIDVTRKDISQLHHDLRDKPYQANRTLGVLSKLFNLAEEWGMRPDNSNPCRHVKKYPEAKRERFLSATEYRRLGAALTEAERSDSESKPAIAAFRLLILTGCRLSEIQTLKWEHVQGDVLALPDSKTGAKRVRIGAPAKAVLDTIERVPGNPYVIAGFVEGQYLTDLQHPWRRIRERAELPDVRIHDLRHSFASGALAVGEALPMIGKLLGHTQVQTTARYAHLADDPVQRAADRVSGEIARSMLPTAAAE